MTASLTANPTRDRGEPAPRPMYLRAAPRREPPFDDELAEARPVRLVGRAQQPLPFEPSETKSQPHRQWSRAGATNRGDLPDPAATARRLLVAVLEARAGLRPVRQLGAYLSPAVMIGLSSELARSPAPAAGGPPATLKSVHVCEPADQVAEISAVVCQGTRHRAIAARLEGRDGRWRCVRLQLG